MARTDHKESADFIRNDLRLKTLPVAVKFLKERRGFPKRPVSPRWFWASGSPFARGSPWRGLTGGPWGSPRKIWSVSQG